MFIFSIELVDNNKKLYLQEATTRPRYFHTSVLNVHLNKNTTVAATYLQWQPPTYSEILAAAYIPDHQLLFSLCQPL